MAMCNRNFMDELHELICEIESLKPEPEVCNIRCPPLGCPQGPCPGMCCYEGICDPCCFSKVPDCPPPPQPPRCCAPPCMPSTKSRGQNLTKPQTCKPNPCEHNSTSPCCTTTFCSKPKLNSKCQHTSTNRHHGSHHSSYSFAQNNNNSSGPSGKPACPVIFWSV